ncbi:MAG: hypothetical protein IPK07_10890 [Deltaproteobacteria bacterium]|nr:hypothetical protein [Deltaproteobacteria bacterium]
MPRFLRFGGVRHQARALEHLADFDDRVAFSPVREIVESRPARERDRPTDDELSPEAVDQRDLFGLGSMESRIPGERAARGPAELGKCAGRTDPAIDRGEVVGRDIGDRLEPQEAIGREADEVDGGNARDVVSRIRQPEKVIVLEDREDQRAGVEIVDHVREMAHERRHLHVGRLVVDLVADSDVRYRVLERQVRQHLLQLGGPRGVSERRGHPKTGTGTAPEESADCSPRGGGDRRHRLARRAGAGFR